MIYPLNTTDSYFTKESDIPVYESGILLVRNPYHALVAEWNRLTSINMSVSDNHINSIDTMFFGEFVCVCVRYLSICLRTCLPLSSCL